MSRAFAADAAALLAEGFAQQVERWALEAGAAPGDARLARHAAAALSLATSDGHVCIALGDLAAGGGDAAAPGDPQRLRDALLASRVVGVPGQTGAMPLVLDADGRLYLHRYFDYECRLARRLVRANTAAAPGATPAQALRTLLGSGAAGDELDWQRLAVALALRGRLVVVSGGPGTGKTTTLVTLLAALLALDPQCRIALAAPTGKAAARMSEAVRERAAGLPDALRARLPAEASTVHRLLGVTREGGGFVHHAGRRLGVDALVVDEASMLDLALATRLLEAVPEHARIVLLGDKDQLCAVESGAVFAELAVDASLSDACVDDLAALTGFAAARIRAARPAAARAASDAVVWLTRNYRFAADSGIGRLASRINAGRADAALALLRAGECDDVAWIDDGAEAPGERTLDAIEAGCADFFAAVVRDPGDHAGVARAYARFRVLCAVRAGPRGVEAINARLERRLRAAQRVAEGTLWYPGRPVMVLRNDPVLGLFNGDVGLALPDAAGDLLVRFAGADGGSRAIAPLRLPEHETALAMTVHKAQGSEFDEVLAVLPEARNRVLTRELVYTAVTRARRRVTLAASASALQAAIDTPTQRRSGLRARLREAAGPA